jgi:hypothetical protein
MKPAPFDGRLRVCADSEMNSPEKNEFIPLSSSAESPTSSAGVISIRTQWQRHETCGSLGNPSLPS